MVTYRDQPGYKPWWHDLPERSRWYHEYLHVNAEHVLGRPLTDVSPKTYGGGEVGCKAYDADTDFQRWVFLTDPHDVPLPDLSKWGR